MTAVRSDHGLALWRPVVVALAALVAAALTATPASTHTALTGSDPEDGDTVTEAIDVVVLEYNEDVDLPQIEVLDPDGENVADGDARDHGDVIEQPLGALTVQGTYTVEWRVVSADDHPIDGAFAFEYEGPVAGDEPAQDESAPDEPVEDAPALGDPVEEPAPHEPVEAPAGEEAAAEEPADEEPVDEAGEEVALEPATAESEQGGALMGLIAAAVLIALVAAGLFALRGRGPQEARPES